MICGDASLRHDLWKEKYPDSHEVYGIPWTGLANGIVNLSQ
jgi:hypothetical protein